MKPIPQIKSNQRRSRRDSGATRDYRGFPLTDYSYQATVEAGGHSLLIPEKAQGISELRTFRKLSNEFLGAETSRDYIAELTLFALIAGVSAWPIISIIATLSRLMK